MTDTASPDKTRSVPPEAESIRIPRLYPIVFPVTRVLVRSLFTLLGGWRVEGREHVPKTGGVLIAANHLSYADPPAVGLAMPRRCWFMGKDMLFRIPVLAPLCRLHLAYPVRVQAVMDRQAIRHTENLLKAGEAVCIYPEGHVSRNRKLAPLQSGLALIALRTGVPIVPTAVMGTEATFPLPYSIPHFARGGVRVRFGPALDPALAPAGMNRREQADWLTAEIDREIRKLLEPAYLPEVSDPD